MSSSTRMRPAGVLGVVELAGLPADPHDVGDVQRALLDLGLADEAQDGTRRNVELVEARGRFDGAHNAVDAEDQLVLIHG